jgi:SynChlorMet cassette protein ScmD
MPIGKGYGTAMNNGEKPIASPLVVLREEFDDWAVLFDPDSGNAFGLSPTGVYLWKLLDGKHSIDDMLKTLHRDGKDVPQEAGGHLAAFVEELTAHGLAGYDVEQMDDDGECLPSRPTCVSEKLPDGTPGADQRRCGTPRYEQPRLESLSLERRAHGNCTDGSHDLAGACKTGNAAGCGSGGSVGYACSTGNTAGFPPGCGGGGLRSPYGFGCGCATGGADFIPVCSSGNAPA